MNWNYGLFYCLAEGSEKNEGQLIGIHCLQIFLLVMKMCVCSPQTEEGGSLFLHEGIASIVLVIYIYTHTYINIYRSVLILEELLYLQGFCFL